MEGFLIAGLLRVFAMLICTVNFQDVKVNTQLVPKYLLTVESVFWMHLVGLEFYRTGVKKMGSYDFLILG